MHGSGGCHMLTAMSEVVTTEPSTYRRWICKPTATQPSVFLFGPASLTSNRAVIYACERNVCHIMCPCLGCTRNSQLDFISVQDLFQDHYLYHHVPHNTCVFCSQLLDIFPAFSYDKFVVGLGGSFPHVSEDMVTKSYTFRHLVINIMVERHYLNVHYKQKF